MFAKLYFAIEQTFTVRGTKHWISIVIPVAKNLGSVNVRNSHAASSLHTDSEQQNWSRTRTGHGRQKGTRVQTCTLAGFLRYCTWTKRSVHNVYPSNKKTATSSLATVANLNKAKFIVQCARAHFRDFLSIQTFRALESSTSAMSPSLSLSTRTRTNGSWLTPCRWVWSRYPSFLFSLAMGTCNMKKQSN